VTTGDYETTAVRWSLMLLALALVLAVAAPIGLTACESASSAALSRQDQIDIYVAVVQRITGPDDSFSSKRSRSVIYIVRSTDDAAADPSLRSHRSVPLMLPVQEGVSAALADLSAKVT